MTVLHGEAAVRQRPLSENVAAPFGFAFFWLVVFSLIYYARPEDWVPGLAVIPLAKVSGAFCLLAFVISIVQMRRRPSREIIFLSLLLLQLWLTVPLSPVWKGGAFDVTLDFSKVLPIVFVLSASVITLARLRRLIFVQAACVSIIAMVSLVKGNLFAGRLTGAVNGIYANSNELSLILVVTLPLCVAFGLRTRSVLRKAVWGSAALLMVYISMQTGSRAGLLALIVSGAVCLWEFGMRGKRYSLFFVAGALSLAMMLFASGTVTERFDAMFGDEPAAGDIRSAYNSAAQRQELLWKSLALTLEHPVFGIGPGNFKSLSGDWHDQHNSYTQMSSEGGLPALLLYILLLWCSLDNLRQTRRMAAPDSEQALFAMALRGSLYGFMVGSFFSYSAYQFFPYFLVGYSSALVAIAETKVEEPATEDFWGETHGEYGEPAPASIAG